VSARRDDLIALLAKVKAGEFDYRTYPLMKLPQMDGFWHLVNAYNGDLNAAKALHEAVLPGWRYLIRSWGKIELETEERGDFHPLNYCTGFERDNPARAWLIAILKALIAEAQPAPHRTENRK
jgi:hypothetical protein